MHLVLGFENNFSAFLFSLHTDVHFNSWNFNHLFSTNPLIILILLKSEL